MSWPKRETEYKAHPPIELKQQGLCSKLKPSIATPLFYPADGGTYQSAMKICAQCPVRVKCAEWAIANGEYGCWGATTDEDRRVIRKYRNRPIVRFKDFKHGNGYSSHHAHILRGELPCDVCVQGWAAVYPATRINRKSKNGRPNEHG